MRRVSGLGDPNVKRLKNLSWLTASKLSKLTKALSASWVDKRGIIFDEKSSSDAAYVLLSGVARFTCRNRNGRRAVVLMLSPGMMPSFPPPVIGIDYSFRCEAVTDCRVGTIDWGMFVEICLGARSADFKRLAANYIGRWNAVQLRCSNFMSCTLAERLALILLELSDDFGIRDVLGMRLTVKARHKDLAELLGASRPRVSEYMKEFEHKGLVARRARQLIVKRDRLENFLLQTHSGYRDGEAHEATDRPTARASGVLSD
jgi:CRP-like cAMP-binding protein